MNDKDFKKLDKLDTDTLDFIFSEACKKLQSVNKSGDLLDKKGFTVISILLVITGLIVPMIIKDFSCPTYLIPVAFLPVIIHSVPNIVKVV